MRILEVCAGIGGFSLAAEWMGWEVAGHVEIDPFCTRVLKHHWPDVPHVNEIYEVRGDEFGAIDLLCGGIPCQPFSVAGKQHGERDPRHLWPEFFRLVLVLRPRWVVVENVSGFIRLALDACWADLESAGYTCGAAVLPACGVNAPHIRQRVWLVAHAAASRPSSRGCVTDWAPRDEAWRPEPERLGGDAPNPGCVIAPTRGQRALATSSGVVGSDDRGRSGSHPGQERVGGARQDTSDAADSRFIAREVSTARRLATKPITRSNGTAGGHETQPRLGVPHDGPTGRMARYLDPRWQGDPLNAFTDDNGWEDGVPRVTAGCENRVAKLKALGNALVPQVAYQVFQTIAEHDHLTNLSHPCANQAESSRIAHTTRDD